jgi:hypothetical protein
MNYVFHNKRHRVRNRQPRQPAPAPEQLPAARARAYWPSKQVVYHFGGGVPPTTHYGPILRNPGPPREGASAPNGVLPERPNRSRAADASGLDDAALGDGDDDDDHDHDERAHLFDSSGAANSSLPSSLPSTSSRDKRHKSYVEARAHKELNWIKAGLEAVRRFFSRISISSIRACAPRVSDDSSAEPFAEDLMFELGGCGCGDKCAHANDGNFVPAALIRCEECRMDMCPTCDENAHKAYSALHARSSHTSRAEGPNELDCYQFINQETG